MDLKFNFTRIITDKARAFEAELRSLQGIEINLPQSCLWLETAAREFVLLQARDGRGSPVGQIAAQIHRPRRAPWYVHAAAGAVGEAFTSAEAERACINALADFLRGEGVSRLRVHFYRLKEDSLARARTLGGREAPPLSYARTLLFDIAPPTDEILASFDKKVRAKILHRSRDLVDIRRLTEPACLADLQRALDAAFARTGAVSSAFDFEPYFRASQGAPDKVLILGLYLKTRPDELLAYSIDVRHGAMVEAVSSGSLPDPELRKLHFNYFLFWEKILWARDGASKTLDLGGVTAGEPNDPLAGISRFKRQFTGNEATVNHERIYRLRTAHDRAFHVLARITGMRRHLPMAAKAAAIAASFAFFSWPLTKVGDPESPAYKALRALGHPPRIAIIGDSRPHTGISPKMLLSQLDPQGKAGLTAHNFAVDGTDAAHHASFAWNGLLKEVPAPQLIIWGVNPLQFDGSRKNNRLEQLHLRDMAELFTAGAPFETLLDVATMGFFAPWRHRPLFATAVADYSERAAIRLLPLQTKVLGLAYEPDPLSREYETLPDGHVPFRVLHWENRFKRGAESYVAEYAALEISEWHLAMARRLAQIARGAGTKLVLVEMPMAPWMIQRLAGGAKHLIWRRRLRDLAKAEGALYLDHSALYGEDTQFGDPGHMPLETALDYSVRLGQQLKTILPASQLGLVGTL